MEGEECIDKVLEAVKKVELQGAGYRRGCITFKQGLTDKYGISGEESNKIIIINLFNYSLDNKISSILLHVSKDSVCNAVLINKECQEEGIIRLFQDLYEKLI